MATIAIVDDDPSVRSATVDLLNSLGFECEAYPSAQAFLDAPDAARTACLILDLNMPGLSGLDLQKRLIEAGASLPIIFITAYPEERTRSQAMRGGALGYLTKPYDDEELLGYLRRALAGPRKT